MEIFGIGISELLVILVIAMIVVGPERMAKFAADLGRFLREFRQTTSEATREFREAFTLEEEKKSPAQATAKKDAQSQEAKVAKPLTPASPTSKATTEEHKETESLTVTEAAGTQSLAAERQPPALVPFKVPSNAMQVQTELSGNGHGENENEPAQEAEPESIRTEEPEIPEEPPELAELLATALTLDEEYSEDEVAEAEPALEEHLEPASEEAADSHKQEEEPPLAPQVAEAVAPETHETEESGGEGLSAPLPTFGIVFDLEEPEPLEAPEENDG